MIRSHKFYSVKLQGRLVRPEGLKPSTCRVEADCSIQLSYGRILSRASGGARTRNLLIKSQGHYQLCYGRKIVFCLRFLLFIPFNFIFFVCPMGFEPTTPTLKEWYASSCVTGTHLIFCVPDGTRTRIPQIKSLQRHHCATGTS